MTRASLSSDLQTGVAGLGLTAARLLKIDFSAGAVLCCAGGGPVTYDGGTYEPNGLWLGVSGIEERAGKPPAASLVMAAAGDMKTRIEAGGYRRTPIELFNALIDTSDGSLIGAWPAGVFRISKVSLQMTKDAVVYRVTCGSYLEDGFRAHPVYPSGTMQKVRYPGDTYMDGASTIRGQELEWGGMSFRVGDSGKCVGADELIDGKRAGDIRAGDVLRIADPDTLEAGTAPVLFAEPATMPGVRITTETGRTLTCSTSAPIATDSGLVRAKHLLNYDALIEGGEHERVVSVERLGDIRVQHIYLGEKCFWVNGFLHHNKTIKVPMQAESIETRGAGGLRPLETLRASL